MRFGICLFVGVSRVVELAWSRRNIDHQGPSAEGRWSRRTYPAMVALHTVAIAVTLVRGGKPRWLWVVVLAAVQPIRAWVLVSLGRRWNTRGAVSSDLKIAVDGPYAYVRHPNYAVVIVELLALPLAFGLRRTALLVGLANAILLTIRIREEESLLSRLPNYEVHFASKPRFLPWMWGQRAAHTTWRRAGH